MMDHFVEANGLRHHLIETGVGARTVVVLHGFLDLARSFEPTCRALAEAGHRVIALDLRGHGETEWAAPSGYYYFTDYMLDLECVLDALGLSEVDLVGHSMGGTLATLFAGVRPTRIRTVTSIEGLGPPELPVADVPRRYDRWLTGMAKLRSRTPRPIRDLDEAVERMRVMHADLPDALGRSLAAHATRPHPSGEGLAWRFDPRHQTQSPVAFRVDGYNETMAQIRAPMLFVAGARGFRLADEKERLARVPDVRTVELEGLGHMLHWHAPERLARVLAEFLSAH